MVEENNITVENVGGFNNIYRLTNLLRNVVRILSCDKCFVENDLTSRVSC